MDKNSKFRSMLFIFTKNIKFDGEDDYSRRIEAYIIGSYDDCYNIAKISRYKSNHYEDNFGIAIMPISILKKCLESIC